jgi:hypothetical protein
MVTDSEGRLQAAKAAQSSCRGQAESVSEFRAVGLSSLSTLGRCAARRGEVGRGRPLRSPGTRVVSAARLQR